MSKKVLLSILVVLALIISILIGTYVGSYNKLVAKDQNVNSKLSQIDNQLQRRNDLIPNLVETVKGYTKHEEQVFKDLADARSRLANSASVQDRANADAQITTALRGLNVIVENYPNLKANENYLRLQDELAGTENRIAVSRKDYNDSVQDFNSYKKTFFVNMFFGNKYQDKQYFKAAAGAEKVPSVKF
ncbi:LemA family protein [Clostridium manihotivorum]|uniref:LemA family protein n=1 Tax=Clostridium manihotivorum TaxID=2320868 RepID=A0A410E1J4_9CLOT|nr:LemA family protein [Clostridium manihotivorum]QAA35171.1 LemA family protein [Clostridium manihotivorum]